LEWIYKGKLETKYPAKAASKIAKLEELDQNKPLKQGIVDLHSELRKKLARNSSISCIC
jgi:hypothetical protein